MPAGSYGFDTNGKQIDETSSATRIWALILGALQALVGAGGGGGGSTNSTIVGATASGNTTSTTSNLSTVGSTTITAGAISIEFILSTDFKGTINGASFDNTGTNAVGVYRLDAPPWKPLAALTYIITAGTAVLTTQV
jgi:hypothetical protein